VNTSPRLLDFFTLEATEYLSRLHAAMGMEPATAAAELRIASRGLRGAATMARLAPVARLAGKIESVSARMEAREIRPTPDLKRILGNGIAALGDLVRSVRTWTSSDDDKTREAISELEQFAPGEEATTPDEIVPISDLFYADAGPHIVEVAPTPRTSFEQKLREQQPPPAAAVSPPRARAAQPNRPRQTPGGLRGNALKNVLASSLATMSGMGNGDAGAVAGPVPIEALLYRGESAVARAAELRAQFGGASGPPPREVFAELCDLVQLAATE
jgi:Chemotaxis protein histidine kinase and related kinases